MGSGPTDVEVFAKNLRAARRKKGVSQMSLGNECGVHPTVIARLETASREPRLTTITKLARGLDVPACDLLKGL